MKFCLEKDNSGIHYLVFTWNVDSNFFAAPFAYVTSQRAKSRMI